MDQLSFERALAGLPLGRIQFFPSIGSTNDLAAQWASKGAPDFSLIVADEQTQGRGRAGRAWFTPPGSALAFSLVLDPQATFVEDLPRWAGLGGLAVAETLASLGLKAELKWPNDVLLNSKKTCGVLAEAHWLGDKLNALILGIGINIASPSVPPAEAVNYPATCVEVELGKAVDRLSFLRDVLESLIAWRPRISSPDLISAWEGRLAFKGQAVQVSSGAAEDIRGDLLGLDEHGRLRLQTPSGEVVSVQAGEIHLRPLIDNASK